MDVMTLNAAISACNRGGAWEQALYLFSAAIQFKVQVDAITHSATISACGKSGRWALALQTFHHCLRERWAVETGFAALQHDVIEQGCIQRDYRQFCNGCL